MEKLEPLKKAFGDHYNQLELVEADLLNKESMFKAIEGADFVVHTASPFTIAQPKDENELIKPAVDGTMAAVEAAFQNKVKRIVITSSVAAIMVNKDPKVTHFTPESWSDTTIPQCTPYNKSKTLAEKCAWDFQKAHANDDHKMEIVTINPGFVLGPNLNKCQFASGDVVKQIMSGDLPFPHMSMGCVDVRDVAQAHLQAILVPEAVNQRFILVGEVPWFLDLATALRAKWGKTYPKIAKKTIPYCVLCLVALFDSEAAAIKPFWGLQQSFDTSKTTSVLGIKFRDVKQATVDMSVTLIETGYIPDNRKK